MSHINDTLTNDADHTEKFRHDMANRYLAEDDVRPRLVWENIRDHVIRSAYGFLVFDDTVIDKHFSRRIELVRKQDSGNAHGVIKGIGVVTCVYVNPQIDQVWIIDYRIYDPEGDGKTTLDHMQDMLLNGVYQKSLEFWSVLMDTWSATKDIMLTVSRTWAKCTTVRSKTTVRWMILGAQARINGEGFPSSAVSPAHGLCCDQRDGARQRGGRP